MKLIAIIFFSISLLNLNAQSLKKAIVTNKDIDSIIDIEKVFARNGSTTAPPGENWFEFRQGSKKILFIAGHATAQMRNGEIKQPDGGTGSLALKLYNQRDVSVLFTTYLSPSDPNYYNNNAFKDSLTKIVAKIKPIIVIDLHASHPYRPYDVDFGTMNGTSYLTKLSLFNRLKTILKSEGLLNQSQDYFPAAANQTITKFLYYKNIPCIQLEINANYLSPGGGDVHGQKTAQLLQALLRFIDTF